MKRKDQKRFVRELTKNIASEVIDSIRAGRIPENWDGIELREYLARRFADASVTWKEQSLQRRRVFNNHITITPGL